MCVAYLRWLMLTADMAQRVLCKRHMCKCCIICWWVGTMQDSEYTVSKCIVSMGNWASSTLATQRTEQVQSQHMSGSLSGQTGWEVHHVNNHGEKNAKTRWPERSLSFNIQWFDICSVWLLAQFVKLFWAHLLSFPECECTRSMCSVQWLRNPDRISVLHSQCRNKFWRGKGGSVCRFSRKQTSNA